MLAERLGSISQRTVIRPPFFCDYGYNIRLGEDVFIRFNCVILDVVSVTIGSRSQVAPRGTDLCCGPIPAIRTHAVAAWNSAGRW